MKYLTELQCIFRVNINLNDDVIIVILLLYFQFNYFLQAGQNLSPGH